MDRLGIRYGYRFDPGPARESVVPLSSDSYNWTGIYAGAQIGGALGSFSNHWPVQDNYFGAGTGIDDATGFFGGGQIGLQQQWGNWVPGIEVAAIQFSNLQGSGAAGVSVIEDEANWSLMLILRGSATPSTVGSGLPRRVSRSPIKRRRKSIMSVRPRSTRCAAAGLREAASTTR